MRRIDLAGPAAAPRGRTVAAGLLACALLGLLGPAAPRAGAQQELPPGTGATIASWEPRYTSYLLLSETDDLVTLARRGDDLWLATERVVSRFRDGVWSEPELVADDAMILALAPMGSNGDLLAFGYEGGAWQRVRGAWSPMDSPTRADLYDAYAWSSQDAWAVGFDYESEYGVLVQFDGFGLRAFSFPWLLQRLLLTIEASPTGELWAGGCDGNDLPFLMRDGGAGMWRPAATPNATGCIEDIAFSADGAGLAAADGDLLWWDGQFWQPFGQEPPEGQGWVRVGLASSFQTAAVPAGPPSGWAIPGVPTWRGYIDAGSPWYYDGYGWSEIEVDYRGYDFLFSPDAPVSGAQPFLDIVDADGGPIAVSRSSIRSELPGQRRAGLMQLLPDVARLEHPLIFALNWPTPGSPAPAGGGDIAALGERVFAAAAVGAAPLLEGQRDGTWAVARGAPADRGRGFWLSQVDFAHADAGWALGGTAGPGATDPIAWRWDGSLWRDAPSPVTRPDREFVQLRALPDGGAWALTPDARLQVFEDGAWRSMADDTPAAGPARAPDDQPQLVGLRAPFDVVAGPAGSLLGWVADREQLHVYVDGRFRAVQLLPRGQVLDLQLVDPARGWAIAYDAEADQEGRPPGVLLQLADRQWSEVETSVGLRRTIAEMVRRGERVPDVDLRTLQWWLMSARDASEVWLVGSVRATGRDEVVPLLVRYRADPRGLAPRDLLVFPNCSVDALSAVTALDGGTEVWLMGRSQCAAAATEVSRQYAGPVSVLRARDTVGTLYLPTGARRAGIRPAP